MILKVKNSPKWFRRWKIDLMTSHRDGSEVDKFTEMILKVKIDLVKSHWDDSEGEKFTEMIPEVKIFDEMFRKWQNFINELSWTVATLKMWSRLGAWRPSSSYESCPSPLLEEPGLMPSVNLLLYAFWFDWGAWPSKSEAALGPERPKAIDEFDVKLVHVHVRYCTRRQRGASSLLQCNSNLRWSSLMDGWMERLIFGTVMLKCEPVTHFGSKVNHRSPMPWSSDAPRGRAIRDGMWASSWAETTMMWEDASAAASLL
jgi:hypothetical protein